MLRPARNTPERLLLATISVILAGLTAGGLGLLGFGERADALDRARAETNHQARLQIILTKSIVADTAAADDVLRGQDQKPIAAREFGYAVEPTVTELVVAAQQTGDATQLAIASRWFTRYVRRVENARTLARAGEQADAASALREASSLLRANVLAPVSAAQEASRARLADDQGAATRATLIAVFGTLLALLVLAGVHWRLTLQTRRIVNVGLVTGLVLLLAVGVAGLITVNVSRHRVDDVQDGPQSVAEKVVEARVAAFDARGRESLSVISDDVLVADAEWRSAIAIARTALAEARPAGTTIVRDDLASTTRLLNTYATAHAELIALARAGQDAEVRVFSAAAGGASGAFEDFDATSGALLARQVQATDDGWAQAGQSLRLLGWLSLVIGLAAAGTSWSGLAPRIREYR